MLQNILSQPYLNRFSFVTPHSLQFQVPSSIIVLILSLSIYIYIYETYFIYLSFYNIKNYDIITRIMGPFHIWVLKAIV